MRITVVISAHPPRLPSYLPAAFHSVCQQTLQPYEIVVANDIDRDGAAATKNRALDRVVTPWTAVLDSDDRMMPTHLERLAAAQAATGADVVYSGGDIRADTTSGRPDRFGLPFDADELRRGPYIPTTVLMRTDLARQVGGFQCRPGEIWDDHGLFMAMLDAGASFHHVPEMTWVWTMGDHGTGGRADGW